MALVSPRRGAWLLAAGRVVLGASILAAPEKITAQWLGEENAKHAAVVDLARGLAVRDVALGAAVLWTLDDATIGPRMQAACAVADSVDTVATLLARADLPRKGVIGTVAVAAGAALAGFYLSHQLAHA
jgi:hypothetical protein